MFIHLKLVSPGFGFTKTDRKSDIKLIDKSLRKTEKRFSPVHK